MSELEAHLLAMNNVVVTGYTADYHQKFLHKDMMITLMIETMRVLYEFFKVAD